MKRATSNWSWNSNLSSKTGKPARLVSEEVHGFLDNSAQDALEYDPYWNARYNYFVERSGEMNSNMNRAGILHSGYRHSC